MQGGGGAGAQPCELILINRSGYSCFSMRLAFVETMLDRYAVDATGRSSLKFASRPNDDDNSLLSSRFESE